MSILAALTGVLTGGGASLLTKGIDVFQTVQLRKLDIEKLELEHKQAVQMHQLQLEMENKKFEFEAQMEDMRASGEAFNASFEHDASYGTLTSNWSVVAMRFVRPLLTFVLLGVSTYFVNVASQMEQITLAELKGLLQELIMLTSTAVSWWFGNRQLEKQAMKAS